MLLILLSLRGSPVLSAGPLLPFSGVGGYLLYPHRYFSRKNNFFPNVSHLLGKLRPPYIILSKDSFHLSFVHSLINLFTHHHSVWCYGYKDWEDGLLLAFIFRIKSFEMPSTNFVSSSKAKFFLSSWQG